jgi:hypothetical protein
MITVIVELSEEEAACIWDDAQVAGLTPTLEECCLHELKGSAEHYRITFGKLVVNEAIERFRARPQ